MEINWIIVGIVAVLAIGIVAYLLRQNRKDRREYEEYLNRTTPKDEADVQDGL